MLFRRPDINGNDFVDWEEFTSFCIELGIVSVKVRVRCEREGWLRSSTTVTFAWNYSCFRLKGATRPCAPFNAEDPLTT